MKRYMISPQATVDLAEIKNYLLGKGGKAVAKAAMQKLTLCFVRLGENPGIGHYRVDLTPRDVKFISVYSYLVIYRHTTKPIQIVRVLHGYRDVPYLLQEGN